MALSSYLFVGRLVTTSEKTFISMRGKVPTSIRNYSALKQSCSISKPLKFRASMLLTHTSRALPRRYFRVKLEKTDHTAKTSPTSGRQRHPRPPKAEKSDSSPAASFWPFAFKLGAVTFCATGFIFGGCALWQERNIELQQERFWDRKNKGRPKEEGDIQTRLSAIWGHLPAVQKVVYTIAGANLLVLIAWKSLSPQVMSKWFLLSAVGNRHRFTNVFLSMFSHKSFLHFFVNMYVLNSFCLAWNQLARRNNDRNAGGHERFLAFYLTAGIFGGVLSTVTKVLGRMPQPSLGASGAIMGLIAYTCAKMPNSRLSIVFIPNWNFSAESAKNFIIAFDSLGLLVGVMSKWRYMVFDHAGHLGGFFFGLWYARYGEKVSSRFSRFITNLRSNR